MDTIAVIVVCILAYFLGSIPTAVWVGTKIYGKDVRDFGSGNAGATNTFRVLGKKAGIFVLFFDVLKGFLATHLGTLLLERDNIVKDDLIYYQMACGILAIIGHIYPIFANFKGGKGVATILGMVIALHPQVSLLSILVFLLILIATHYVSLGSIIAGFSFPIFLMTVPVFRQNNPTLVIFSTILALVLVYTHRVNIKRLLAGNENKIYLFRRRNA
ncbi:acyl-phosphate glycerol 3-phosphate acyltransferase [bacterium 336/3]|jgi:acyl phosphate:glycerol-3-phosphate acyltransferase|nr:acyl-phosphate glycerol 3-phosphate acyltransferase [bacterium 336/3]